MISVIIPVFNCEKYVSEAVESVLLQTYQDFEVIVVNDGSTDNTEEVLKAYFDRIIYIYQENKGIAAARNTGIRASKGKYLAFLDSDDIWEKDKLDGQVIFLNTNKEFDLVYEDYIPFNDKGLIRDHFSILKDFPRPSGNIFKPLILSTLFPTSTVIVKRDVLDDLGIFDESFKMGEDYELWLRIAGKYNIGYLKQRLVRVRYHQKSITKVTKVFEKPWEIRAIEKALDIYPKEKKKIKNIDIRKRISGIYMYHGYGAFWEKRYAAARYHFGRCIINWPFNSRAFIYYFISITFSEIWRKIIDATIKEPSTKG